MPYRHFTFTLKLRRDFHPAENVTHSNNCTVSGNYLEWRFSYYLYGSFDLWPMPEPLALIRQKTKGKDVCLVLVCFFFFPQQDHSTRACLCIVNLTKFLYSLLPGARLAFPVHKWAGRGKNGSLLLYVALVGFGFALVWFPLSMLLFCPWTHEIEFMEAVLIVSIQRVCNTSG